MSSTVKNRTQRVSATKKAVFTIWFGFFNSSLTAGIVSTMNRITATVIATTWAANSKLVVCQRVLFRMNAF